MKKILLLILVVSLFVNNLDVFGQFTNSRPNNQCGATAYGTITFTGPQSIIGWEEGYFNPNNGTFVLTTFTGTSVKSFNYNFAAPANRVYRVRISSSPYQWIGYSPVVTAFLQTVGGILTGNAVYMESGSGTINLSGNANGTVSFGSNSGLTFISNGNYSYSLTQTRTYQATVSNAGCSSSSNPVTIKVYKKGTLAAPASATIGNRVTATLTAYDADGILGWEYSIDNGNTWTFVDHPFNSYRHEVTADTKFRVKLNFGSFGSFYTDPATTTAQEYSVAYPNPIFLYGDSVGNYSRENTIIVQGITNPSAVASLTSTQKRESATFYDGLGRPAQTKVRKATPDQKDIIGVVDYDRLGRSKKQYLPYVSNVTNKFYFLSNYLSEQSAFYNNSTNNMIAKSTCAYTQMDFEKSPLGKVTSQSQVGNCSVNSTTLYATNIANEVRLFNQDGTSSGFYPVNELTRMEFIDEDGKKTQTFTDKSGRMILSRIELNETVDGTFVPWLETYHIYFESGAVRSTISPKGINALKAASWSFSQSIKDQYVHEFVYDERGRLIEKKVPGQAWTYYCYDPLDRLVLAQDGNMRPQYKWVYIKYDLKGRIVQQGVYTVPSPSNSSRAAVQSVYVNTFYGSGTPVFFEDNAGTNLTFPTSNSEVLIQNYYDGVGPVASYVPQGLPGEGTEGSNLGLLTYSTRKILGTSTVLETYYIYDKNGRVIQVKGNNHLAPTLGNDRATAVYDFEGKVTTTKTYHDAGGGRITSIVNKYLYDHMGRLTHVYQNNNGASTDQLNAKYEYNGLGQLVSKKLHNTSGSSFLQSVDYRYTITGAIRSINGANLYTDPSINPNTNSSVDLFGIELLYNTIDSNLGNTAYQNGSLSAIKWKGLDVGAMSSNHSAYLFSYDKTNRLTSATSKKYSGTAWTKESAALNEVATYDLNGNIKTMARNQRQHQVLGTYGNEMIDNLTYTYNASMGDQLQKVTDATNKIAGFNNGASASNNDYTYNSNGDLLTDLNKGISNITYNLFGKPDLIQFSDGRKIEYVYDAAGTKLAVKAYENGSTTPDAVTDYAGSFVYENQNLNFFSSPEGRVVKNGGNLEYQYGIADHQGNTRVVFTSASAPTSPTATFEDLEVDAEHFLLPVDLQWGNHPLANNTPGGQKIVRVNSNYPTGPARSIKVYPGDVINMSVWTYFEGASGFGSAQQALQTLIASVAGTLGGVNGAPGESGLIYSGVNSAYVNIGRPGNVSDATPAAYLNYIQFDKNYNLLDMGYTIVPASANTSKKQISINPKFINEEGYLFVYLSYDGNGTNFVYFDDFTVSVSPNQIVQYNEYYPFGLQTSSSWIRENNRDNKFLYNSGSELNSTTGWYETFFRNYDAAIGRFTGIDPMATMYASKSGYHYAANNPVMINDPTGASYGYGGNSMCRDAHGNPIRCSGPSGTRQDNGGHGGSSYDNFYANYGDWSVVNSLRNPGFMPRVWNMIEHFWSITPWGSRRLYEEPRETYGVRYGGVDRGGTETAYYEYYVSGYTYGKTSKPNPPQEDTQRRNYSFGTVGFAPLEYEAGKGSTQSIAKYTMDVTVSVYEVPVYNNEGKIVQFKSKATVTATSFVSAKGGSRVIPSAWASINISGASGGYLEKLELKVMNPAFIKGGGQYTYVGEATFDLALNPAYIITFGGSWVIQYDNGMRFVPMNAPYIGFPISVGGDIKITR